MIVYWKRDGLCMVPIIQHTDETRIGTGGKRMVRLIPGYNDVPDDIYNTIRPDILDLLASGELEEFGQKKKELDDDGNVVREFYYGAALRRQPPAKAAEMVKNCFNLDTLNLWLKGDDEGDYESEVRPDIRSLIDDQIKKIKQGGKREEELGAVGIPIR